MDSYMHLEITGEWCKLVIPKIKFVEVEKL